MKKILFLRDDIFGIKCSRQMFRKVEQTYK